MRGDFLYTISMDIIETLLGGGVALTRTDTIYGLLARATDEQAVAKVYAIKGRDFTKPCIVLVARVNDIPGLTHQQRLSYQSANGERPTSLIVPASNEPDWITRGTSSVAYRVCRAPKLREILIMTGPLIAPSANPQGMPPARTIEEAKDYFSDSVDYYLDGGEVTDAQASRLMTFHNNVLQHVAR